MGFIRATIVIWTALLSCAWAGCGGKGGHEDGDTDSDVGGDDGDTAGDMDADAEGDTGVDASDTTGWTGIIDPGRATDWSGAGVIGGIPDRTTVCATLDPGATSDEINAAIASCGDGEVVYLNAGTYDLAEGITFAGRSNVTLRGAGPDRTLLVFSGSDGCGGMGGDVCISNSTQLWAGHADVQPGGSHATTWTSGYAKGTTTIVLGDASGLSPGDTIILDQLDDTADGGEVFVCQEADLCATEGPGGQGRENRSQMAFVQIESIDGNEVTLTQGLNMPNWRSGQSPGAWWTGEQAEWNGIEDLSMDHTAGTGRSGLYFYNARNCWARNVRSLNSDRNHVWVYLSSHVTIEHSYFYGTKNAASQSYGIEHYGAADVLVVNNIFQHITGAIIGGNNLGSVAAYNYGIDDYYFLSPAWMMPSISMHAAEAGMLLYEGNEGAGLQADAIHGTSHFITGFRNYWIGWEEDKTMQTIPVHVYAFHRYYNIIGNVLGRSGTHTAYENVAPSGTTPDVSIYALGWSSNQSTFSTVPDDALVRDTLMRWGNYDVVTGDSRWEESEVPTGDEHYGNPVPASRALPASFFLPSQPAWWATTWGTPPWPAIGPDVTGEGGPGNHVADIPAKLCFDNTGADPAYAPDPVLLFDAADCYLSY